MMKNNPFIVSIKAKGVYDAFRRIRSITKRYGLNPNLMDQALRHFSELLQQFDCGATFPITAVTLKRHEEIIKKYLDRNIEFAVHGYTHVDYSQLSQEIQLDHLKLAIEVFAHSGIKPVGYRSPYLHSGENLLAALDGFGFSYVSNQPILWDVLEKSEIDSTAYDRFNRAVSFYNPWLASERLSLPRFGDHLLEIPVSLPDDEILIERLYGDKALVKDTWRSILHRTYQRGELFTLQLHPERISLCAEGVASILSEARALSPAVWCTRLDEISNWWKARAHATIEMSETENGSYHCVVTGPSGTVVLARGVEIDAASSHWANDYQDVKAHQFNFRSSHRPSIGLSPSTSLDLANFLRRQGYLVETGLNKEKFSCYFNQVGFDVSQEKRIIDEIEGSKHPLIKLGRWPNGAKSALAITGDIDALTIWDYGLRLLGK